MSAKTASVGVLEFIVWIEEVAYLSTKIESTLCMLIGYEEWGWIDRVGDDTREYIGSW